ncbi:putative glycosyltransferase family 28 domain-containing protein [Rosellinia necatrix]|uniref:Putative glycosyltransferase family 28 domain-containing protein n=1 Tax=Rosellinia necatrix TaxID=77044 RepID=A0A1W2TBP9_ROSNE|nr:putative glycosyltransferase family 28 domain-containing protein [Rosellinia necatrix]
MSTADGKSKRADAAQLGEHARAEQAPIPISPPQLPPRSRSRTGSDLAPGLVVTDDSQNYNNGFLPEPPELVVEEDVPPAYSEFHDQLNIHQAGFNAGAAITDDGRIDININQTSRHLADFIAPTLRSQLRHDGRVSPDAPLPPAYIPPSLGGQPGQTPPPRLNVVIQIVGSRGDVQPFIALGQVLKNTYGHRVRVATHATFQKFVEENGLEFFAIGGDPAELMAFMVKNPGLMPGLDALKNGEITKRRKGIEQIIMGCWRSCIETGDGLGPAPRFSRKDEDIPSDAIPVMGDSRHKPFVADVIIANPPSFAHIHVAEKLGVPLHLMFTMPWSPTRAFPQPLANIQSSNTDPVTTNYLSYAMVEMMTWQGLGDVINRFRTKVLDLDPLALIWAPGVLTRLRIPYTYCWSPALIPKPNDWGSHIDIAGFYFLNLASAYTPEPELAAFLAAGPPPVYIGFGSIVVDDPDGLTKVIFEAVAQTGVRALVSKGWGGLGADSMGVPEGVFMLGNVPHDWLFKNVSAVCHHGGAGTTAAGIQAGKPTIVVPFFGDQPFWGSMVARAGAGPDPIPYKRLTAEGLAEAIIIALRPETQEKAKILGQKIREEQGADIGAQSFHRHLNVDALRCAVAPSRVAVWRVRRSKTHLSALAAATLVNSGCIRYSDLKLFRAKEYDTENYPTDPISACTSALVGDATSIFMSAADIPRDIFKAAVGSKSTEKVAAGDTVPGSSTDDVVTQNTSEPRDSDSASVFSNTPSMRTSNNSTVNLTPTTTATSNSSSTFRQLRNIHGTGAETMPTDSVNQQLERVLDSGKSINNIIATGVKSPMNFCMGLARGFRNAPNLYNDDTIRPTEKVTSFSSGLKVAGKEFGFGFFDGITGLVTQPLKGAEKEGGAGLLKGFGKGIGGLILKPAAAIWSLPAYTMAGVHAEIRTMFAQSAHKYIVASRISQGNHEYGQSSAEERDDIEMRWLRLKDGMKGFYALKQKEKGKSRDASPSALGHASTSTETLNEVPKTGWFQGRNVSADERRRLQEQKKAWRRKRAEGPFVEEDVRGVYAADHTRELDDEFETAIQAAVHETSRGDAAEDARIEQAIRSSVKIMRRRSATMSSVASSNSAFSNRGGQLSGWVPDVKRPLPDEKREYPFSPDDLENITDEEYQALIEEAIKLSITENQQRAIRMQDLEEEDSDDDENIRRALKESQAENPSLHDDEYKKALEASQVESDDEVLRRVIEASQIEQETQQRPDEDDELKRALDESEKAHQQELARINSLRSEEDIVMEYVKKQSLAEAAFRNAKGKNAGVDGETTEDEELRWALEESMKTDNKIRQGGGGGPSQY